MRLLRATALAMTVTAVEHPAAAGWVTQRNIRTPLAETLLFSVCFCTPEPKSKISAHGVLVWKCSAVDQRQVHAALLDDLVIDAWRYTAQEVAIPGVGGDQSVDAD